MLITGNKLKKGILILGLITSLPLIIVDRVVYYILTSKKIFLFQEPENLYVVLVVCAVGVPIYFYFAMKDITIKNMIGIIAIAWTIFSISGTASVLYSPAANIEPSFLNMMLVFSLMSIAGFLFLASICSGIALLGERLFSKKDV